MTVSFEGTGQKIVTFEAADGVTAGMPVKMSENRKVAAAAAGDIFCGVALDAAEDGFASVVLGGFVTLPYTGTAPSVGYVKLAADGSGGVTVGDKGRDYLVTEADTAAGTAGFYIG